MPDKAGNTFLAHLIHYQMCLCYRKLEKLEKSRPLSTLSQSDTRRGVERGRERAKEAKSASFHYSYDLSKPIKMRLREEWKETKSASLGLFPLLVSFHSWPLFTLGLFYPSVSFHSLSLPTPSRDTASFHFLPLSNLCLFPLFASFHSLPLSTPVTTLPLSTLCLFPLLLRHGLFPLLSWHSLFPLSASFHSLPLSTFWLFPLLLPHSCLLFPFLVSTSICLFWWEWAIIYVS